MVLDWKCKKLDQDIPTVKSCSFTSERAGSGGPGFRQGHHYITCPIWPVEALRGDGGENDRLAEVLYSVTAEQPLP